MEKNTLATLVATSILTALSPDASIVQDQCNNSGIHETITSSKDMHTCGQCKGPTRPARPVHNIMAISQPTVVTIARSNSNFIFNMLSKRTPTL